MKTPLKQIFNFLTVAMAIAQQIKTYSVPTTGNFFPEGMVCANTTDELCVELSQSINHHSMCSDGQFDLQCANLLLPRDHKLLSHDDFLTETHVEKREQAYVCSRYCDIGLFADSQALHDSDTAILLQIYLNRFATESKIGFIGNLDLHRNTKEYSDLAFMSKHLAEKGYVFISGGEPGMEAVHLGAWFACHTDNALLEAIEMLAKAPYYYGQKEWNIPFAHEWDRTAREVQEKYPRIHPGNDIAIASIYHGGHEPAAVIAHMELRAGHKQPPMSFASRYVTILNRQQREEAIVLSASAAVIFTAASPQSEAGLFTALKYKRLKNNEIKEQNCNKKLILLNTGNWAPYMTEQVTLVTDSAYDSASQIIQHIPQNGKDCRMSDRSFFRPAALECANEGLYRPFRCKQDENGENSAFLRDPSKGYRC